MFSFFQVLIVQSHRIWSRECIFHIRSGQRRAHNDSSAVWDAYRLWFLLFAKLTLFHHLRFLVFSQIFVPFSSRFLFAVAVDKLRHTRTARPPTNESSNLARSDAFGHTAISTVRQLHTVTFGHNAPSARLVGGRLTLPRTAGVAAGSSRPLAPSHPPPPPAREPILAFRKSLRVCHSKMA